MLRSLRIAEKAMQFEQVRIDALANNLANVDAVGFRQVLTRVAESNTAAVGSPGPDGLPSTAQRGPRTVAPDRGWLANRNIEMYHATDVRGGPIRNTGRQTDLAILGEGFFVVQSGDEELYTRAGAFRLDETRRLVTPDGNPVQGTGGPIVAEGSSFAVAADGTVTVDGAVAGRVKLVTFDDPTRLMHRAGSLLAAPDDVQAQPLPAERVELAQGHVEGSNVNAIDTLVDMIAAQRAFEIEAKILSANDEMLEKSVNKLSRIT